VVLRTKVLGTICSFFSSQYRAVEPGVKYFLLFAVPTQQSTCFSVLNMRDLPEFLQTKYVGNNLKQFMLYFFCSSSNSFYVSNVYWTVHHCNSWRM